ncbi:MAG: tripartite tricarboxylate transporter substrate binding protein [Proteobacteria bacterium]|jgi:tripartite-type tricarboxylate transporter receptor subunit TctC|nr:tripartite tricarboxylate transporter substrate binding protein [Pseudomonadota bacterium]
MSRSICATACAIPCSVAAALFVVPAAAQPAQPSQPDRPVRWISPFAAGGGSDLTTRTVAARLAGVLGQPVVVDNRVGASGNIGAELAARAPADGLTLVTMTVSIVTNHAVSPKPPFDIVRDFSHLSQLTAQPYVLLVHPGVKATSVQELVALASARPGTLNYGSSGIATLQHLAGALFGATTRTDVVHVPYKGGGPALTDLIGGQLQFFFGVMTSSLPHIKAGRLRALAVTSTRRSPIAGELPTMGEAGVPGYVVDNWYGVSAPARTPPAIVARLNAAIATALSTPEVREALLRDGSEPVGDSAASFTATVQRDLALWRKVVRDAGIKPE